MKLIAFNRGKAISSTQEQWRERDERGGTGMHATYATSYAQADAATVCQHRPCDDFGSSMHP